MQFGSMPGCSTTDAISIVCQLQEKFYAVNKILYMAFVDLEKAFDRVARCVIWWALHKLGIDEWLVWSIQRIMKTPKAEYVLVAEFSVKVDVHHGSCLSPLLFSMVLEAFSQEFHTGYSWENLYSDDLFIITESLVELQQKLGLWKTNMEGKGLWVIMGKTEVLIYGQGLNVLQKSGKDPWGMCLKGFGTNSIF